MANDSVQDQPSNVEVRKNAVHVEGPGGVDVSLTPKAALATAKRIEDAAVEAIVGSVTNNGGHLDATMS